MNGPIDPDWRGQWNTRHQWAANLIAILYTIGGTLTIVIMSQPEALVCSGWYLSDLEKENDIIRSFYEIDTGLFLFVMLIFNAVYLGLSLLCCLACCCGITSY